MGDWHIVALNSECLEAETPRQTWPQLAAAALGLELDNFALAGNAQLDPFVARTLAARPADVVSLKLGVMTVWVRDGGTWRLLAHQSFKPT